MAVNTLVTGLIVFRILKVFLEVNAISVEQTLDSAGDNKLRQVIFIIIESGMALFVAQLVCVVLSILAVQEVPDPVNSYYYELVTGIHQMFNVIIKICFISTCFVLLINIYLN